MSDDSRVGYVVEMEKEVKLSNTSISIPNSGERLGQIEHNLYIRRIQLIPPTLWPPTPI